MSPGKKYERILIATTNAGKAKEIEIFLQGCAVTFFTLKDVPPIPEPLEDGETFEENCLIKSRYYSGLTGIPSVADDSGLMADALDGFPGVNSARMAGDGASDDERNLKLLEMMNDVGVLDRGGKFVCAAAFNDPVTGIELTSIGTLRGRIGCVQEGSEGFGFDPLFIPDGYDKPLAALGLELKNRISHRRAAFESMASKLRGM